MSRTWSELLGDAVTEADEQERTGFFGRMRESLAKSRRALTAELASAAFDQIGIEVAELTAGARRQYDLPADLEGVVITDVAVRGEAYDKGLRPGMIVSEVNRRPVASVREFRTAVDAVEPGGLLTLYVELGEDRGNFVTFRVGGSR